MLAYVVQEGEEVLDQFVASIPASIEEKKSTGAGATAPDKDIQRYAFALANAAQIHGHALSLTFGL